MTDTAHAARTPLQITKDLLKPWSPCADGYKWFLEKFPQGGTYVAVQAALRTDNRTGDARWLADHVWSNLLFKTPSIASDITQASKEESDALIEQTTALKVEFTVATENADGSSSGDTAQIGSSGDTAQIGSSGNDAQIGSSGNYARIGSSGSYAQIGSSGNVAQIGSSGNDAQIGSSGNYARIGSSGNDAQIGSSGNYARIGSSGSYARINAEGKNAVVCCAGLSAIAAAGENGVLALTWFDAAANRKRVAVGYVGEGLQAGVFYRVNHAGEFVEVPV